MRTHSQVLEAITNDYLNQVGEKPNFSNRDFFNAVLIFQTALMDKLYDMQTFDEMTQEQKVKMAEKCGEELRLFIYTFTGLDMHQIAKEI